MTPAQRRTLILLEDYDRLPVDPPTPSPKVSRPKAGTVTQTPHGEIYWIGEPVHVGTISPRQDLTLGPLPTDFLVGEERYRAQSTFQLSPQPEDDDAFEFESDEQRARDT